MPRIIVPLRPSRRPHTSTAHSDRLLSGSRARAAPGDSTAAAPASSAASANRRTARVNSQDTRETKDTKRREYHRTVSGTTYPGG